MTFGVARIGVSTGVSTGGPIFVDASLVVVNDSADIIWSYMVVYGCISLYIVI